MDKLTLVPLEEHITLTSSDAVKTICAPLSSSLNTNYFSYVRRFVDGSEFCLTTDAQWTSLFLKEKLYNLVGSNTGNVGCIESGSQIKILPWAMIDSKISSIQKSFSNISIGITIANIKPKYTDFYYFGTYSHEKWMSEFYLSNTDLLLRFCNYFHEQASDLLKLSEKNENLIYLPNTFSQKTKSNNILIDEFLKDTQVKKHTVNTPGGLVPITKKEMQCMQLLCQGSNAREIAEHLFLSQRTVETHINNIKNKVNITSKSDLIKLFVKHRITLP